jgi:hypothetical protein
VGVVVGAFVFWQAANPFASRVRPMVAEQPRPVLSPSIPVDLPANPTQADAVTFAWQSFVALNWPADTTMRGAPDTTKRIGQPGVVVWNTWKAPEEIFLPGARPPLPWNQHGVIPPSCTAAGAHSSDFTIQRIAKVPGGAISPELQTMHARVAGVRTIQGGGGRGTKQVFGGTLTDQHGNLARYEVRVNQTIFNAIVVNQWYNRTIQDQAKLISLPNGVMEVKAAWREMTPKDSARVRARYFRRAAWIYTPPIDSQPATCVRGEVGLVGLHISHKTPTLQQWGWATFEQVDNVPPFVPGTIRPVSAPYSFNNPACADTVCIPNKSTENPPGHPTGIPTQVKRKVNIDTVAQRLNPAWQQALNVVPGSPFPFYRLIGFQWQTSGSAPATPFLLANTTLETYVDQSSCVSCHYLAKTASAKLSSDYSYILAEAQFGPALRTTRKAGR